MYTSGIRKIFSVASYDGIDLASVEKLAVLSGYHALNYKGDIYFRLTKKGWIKSPFRMIDFVGG